MKNKLDFHEIANWEEFEDLVAAYFREVQKTEKDIIEVKVQPSGKGQDGGRDILVTFDITDSIMSFKRVWVIQCKFYSDSVSKTQLSTINIPSLIHEYGACGYLLVCKTGVTSPVSDMFERLDHNCRLGYKYVFWTGDQFKARLRVKPDLIQQYFPEHWEFLVDQKRRLKI